VDYLKVFSDHPKPEVWSCTHEVGQEK